MNVDIELTERDERSSNYYTVRGKLGSVKKSPVTPGVTGAVRL